MTKQRISRLLSRGALALAVLGIAVWAFSGARLGWTQTSIVEVQRDEITGIDYPVRRAAFLPGVEVPIAAATAAAALAVLSWGTARRTQSVNR